MKRYFLFLALIIQLPLQSQDIINLVLVGKSGITTDIKEATSFVLVKTYPGGIFERLDYKMSSPLVKLRTYHDSNLTKLHGVYIEYFSNGDVQVRGSYQNDLKDREWYYYNDTGKHIRTETFEAGKLLKTENPDTIAKKKDSIVYKDEREADLKGGRKAWIKYLQEHLNSNVALQSARGGQVRVQFRVTKEGGLADIYLKKSVEFVLDEEALRVVRNSPKWIPAFQNGKPLNAYRVQPLTFIKD